MKGKNRKARKEVEAINIHSENEINETISTSNEVNSDNIENYFLSKNMVCSEAQTEIKGINVKIIVFG